MRVSRRIGHGSVAAAATLPGGRLSASLPRVRRGEPTWRGGPRFRPAARRSLSHDVPDVTDARPLGKDAHEERRSWMSRADGLYTAVQRQVINQMLKLAGSDDKAKIVKAFRLAEKITPDQYKGSVRFVADKVKDDHPALYHRQARLLETQPALSRRLHRMSYREQPSSRHRQAQGSRGTYGDVRTDDDPHEPHHALQSHLRRLLRGGVLARQGSRQGPPSEDRGRGQRHGRLPVHAARRRALHVRGTARLRARQQGRLLPGLHQRHTPRPRHHRRARQDRQHRADAQPRGLARAHRPAPWRWGARSGHGDHGPPRRGRRGVRLLLHRRQEQLAGRRQRRVRRPADRQGRHAQLALPLHAGRS